MYTRTSIAINKFKWLVCSNQFCITLHYRKISTHVWCKVNFVNYKKIATFNSKTTLSRILVSSRNIYNVNKIICKCRTKCSHDVVTTTFYYYQVQGGIFLFDLIYNCQINRGGFTNSRMWTPARCNSYNHVFWHYF